MILQPFNSVFWVLMAGMVALISGLWLLVRRRDEKMKTCILIGLCVLNLLIFIAYKILLSMDKNYWALTGVESFNWFSELPLHLCNINMFLIPLGILTRSNAIKGFSFYAAPLGALMAMIFPDAAFRGYAVTEPRILGFYVTHMLIFVCGISLLTFGFYRPAVKDLPRVAVTVFVIALAMHGVNALLRSTVCPEVNYFFTFGADISILNLFWSWIPIPFLYLLPAVVIMALYMAIFTVPFAIVDRRKKTK